MFLFFFDILLLTFQLNAQESISTPVRTDKLTIGAGIGFDHGGFGGNILIYPAKNAGLFAGAGYALAGVGINAGIKLRLATDNPETRVMPIALFMYGYNAAIAVTNATQYNKLFYGPTIGIGCDYRRHPLAGGYWSIALLLPFRSSEVEDYMDDLETNHGVEFKNELLPVGISIGYKFIIN